MHLFVCISAEYKAFMFAAHVSTLSFLVCICVSALCGSFVVLDCWRWLKMLPSGTDSVLLRAGSNDRPIWNNKDRNKEKRRWVMTAWKGYSISWQSELLSYKTDWIFACGASAAWAHVQYAQIFLHTQIHTQERSYLNTRGSCTLLSCTCSNLCTKV